jgi:hypothetical protein
MEFEIGASTPFFKIMLLYDTVASGACLPAREIQLRAIAKSVTRQQISLKRLLVAHTPALPHLYKPAHNLTV